MSAARATVQVIQPARSRNAAKSKRQRVSKRITMRQAKNMIKAVAFAKSIELPLVAHLTIHWSLTGVGDDPDGRLFAKVREGLGKWLGRRRVEFAAVWVRERQSNGQSDVVHCHMLFHLPHDYRTGKKLSEVEEAPLRLVRWHGNDVTDDRAIKFVIHENPDGKYLIKGGGPQVWKRFRLRKEHRRSQGLIHGKRCGTTENIGQAARRRWNNDHERNKRCASGKERFVLSDEPEAAVRLAHPLDALSIRLGDKSTFGSDVRLRG